jgi:DNA-directed RNA polymerase specialized sigma24 family protein
MPSSDSVTRWIRGLQDGDQEAARPLYERYFQRLIGLARTRLRGVPTGRVSPEDVAAHAFASFCVRLGEGGFGQLRGRDDLWNLLARIVVHKALKAVRFHTAQGRDFRLDLSLSAPGGSAAEPGEAVEVDLQEQKSLSPDVLAEMNEEVQRRLDSLGDETLRAIALARLEGCSNADIATRLEVAPDTVERKLRRIRAIWRREEKGQ